MDCASFDKLRMGEGVWPRMQLGNNKFPYAELVEARRTIEQLFPNSGTQSAQQHQSRCSKSGQPI
jgi:hypothetical protein